MDLRGALRYARRFRDSRIVLALDGPILTDAGALAGFFSDLAALETLGVGCAVIYGLDGRATGGLTGADAGGAPADAEGIAACERAAGADGAALLRIAGAAGLRAALANVLEGRPAGIVGGRDMGLGGRGVSADAALLGSLVDSGAAPALAPLGLDGRGGLLRLSLAETAAEVARAIGAAKLVFASAGWGAVREVFPRPHLRVDEAEALCAEMEGGESAAPIPPLLRAQLRWAARACRGGVARAHFLDGRDGGALLAEMFSAEGVGRMIHADAYDSIRPARPADVPELAAMMREAMEDGDLLRRSEADLAERLEDFLALEFDGTPVACAAVHMLDARSAELACLFVARAHEGRGHGTRLALRAEQVARERGARRMFALTTSAAEWFERCAGYAPVPLEDLPAPRREQAQASGRAARTLAKRLDAPPAAV